MKINVRRRDRLFAPVMFAGESVKECDGAIASIKNMMMRFLRLIIGNDNVIDG